MPVVLRKTQEWLAEAGVPSPAQDARQLLAFTLGIEPNRLLVTDAISEGDYREFAELIVRRAAREPLQHLTGRAWFRRVELEVGPGVFVPRPETEVMTGWAIEQLRSAADRGAAPVVVELCTGSGAIAKAIADEVPGCVIHAVEMSEEAFGYASRNLARTGVRLAQGDMADAFGELDGSVDLVIANPPYIPLDAYESVVAEAREHDPTVALFSGEDGLVAIRVVAGVGSRLLKRGGIICAEHAEAQHRSAPQVFVDQGSYAEVRDHRDLTGRPRFVTANRR